MKKEINSIIKAPIKEKPSTRWAYFKILSNI